MKVIARSATRSAKATTWILELEQQSIGALLPTIMTGGMSVPAVTQKLYLTKMLNSVGAAGFISIGRKWSRGFAQDAMAEAWRKRGKTMNEKQIFYAISVTVSKYGFENVTNLLVRSRSREAETLLTKLPGASACTEFVHRLPLLAPGAKTLAR